MTKIVRDRKQVAEVLEEVVNTRDWEGIRKLLRSA